ncbi:MAG TPA: helix-turn-helix domain-containing protein [Erysipelothrix sp.]
MNHNNIKKLYPQAKEANYPNYDKNIYNYFDGVRYLHINKEDITPNEQQLLDLLSIDIVDNSPWYDFLIKGNDLQFKDGIYQCIHFHVEESNSNRQEWLLNFKSFFNDFQDCFFIDEFTGVLVRNYSELSRDQLEGFISLLDDDFSSKTSLYIGMPSNISSLQKVFKEEQQIFKNSQKNQQVSNLVDAYLPYYIIPHLNDSPMFSELRSYIHHDQDLKKVITALWEAQGNLSSASKSLHLHRNTLIYRIDKFQQDININLRNMKELFLAYLLTF